MKDACAVLTLVVLTAPPAAAQVRYQTQQRVQFALEGLARQEWTTNLFGDAPDQSRWRLRALPRLELHLDSLTIGVGADLNHSKDDNVEPLPGLLRDNYDSKSARLDLAFARLDPAGWLRLEGGRFAMPLELTEMIWDRDLRPQGAAATLTLRGQGGSFQRLDLTVLGARGSHVFEDGELFGDGGTTLAAASARASFQTGPASRLVLVGSYLQFSRTSFLEPMIRRQNTRVAGRIVNDYEVVDLVVRLVHEGQMHTQVVADYCRNLAVDADNTGLWLALILGSLENSNGQLDYTYAKVDRDATLAAYATDDFFWATGWEGHRADLGLRMGDRSALHLVGQLQRFKDSPRVEEREHWVKRLRLEIRIRS